MMIDHRLDITACHLTLSPFGVMTEHSVAIEGNVEKSVPPSVPFLNLCLWIWSLLGAWDLEFGISASTQVG